MNQSGQVYAKFYFTLLTSNDDMTNLIFVFYLGIIQMM